jgi:hypothetical protein
MLGSATLAGMPLLVRRLAPQEDKLDLGRLDLSALPELAAHLGALLGAAHRRGGGAEAKTATAWTDDALSGIVERAIVLAGIHEAAYLAFCRLTANEAS